MKKINNKISWIILAGGKSTRMGGNDKGFIKLNDIPLIEHIFTRLSAQISTISINANRNQEKYATYSGVISDDRSGFEGPLAGIETALKHSDTQWVGFTPCDCPQLSPDLVKRLTNELSPDVDIYVATTETKIQPVFSLWNKKVLPQLTQYLNDGDRKIMLFLDRCNTKTVDFSDQPECFINLNQPDDIKEFGTNNEKQPY